MTEYPTEPEATSPVDTPFRTIRTALPVPESLPLFAKLRQAEPRSMQGQPPVVWDHAENFTVHDKWGNRWIDWSSGVLVTNAGHSRPEIRDAVLATVSRGLMTTYVFAHEQRIELVGRLQALAPEPDNYQVFLLTTGSEATENCIKLSKTYARHAHGPNKKIFVSFLNGFHGRTMGAQLAGGMAAQKAWLGDLDPTFVQVPFPDGYKVTDTSFDLFRRTLAENDVRAEDIAGVMVESYQGVGPDFMPDAYARELEAFCREHDIVLTADEVQAGFGRTGRMFTFEHYGIQPDLIACGKGISSSLPLSAVIGRRDIMALYPPGSMTSTHSASPACVAAAIANIEVIQEDGLVENAARMGEILIPGLHALRERYPDALGCVHGRGLVAGIQVVKPGSKEPDSGTAKAINWACARKGLLMFSPVGIGGECIKIAPPLTIIEDALREGLDALGEAVAEVLG